MENLNKDELETIQELLNEEIRCLKDEYIVYLCSIIEKLVYNLDKYA